MNKLDAVFNKLRGLINSVFARGTITLVNDDTKMQSTQVKFLADEVLDGLERFQDYGFTSKPKVGAEALAIFFGGRRSNGAVIKVDDRRYRIKGLQDGEVAIYTDEGDKIVLKRGNKIEVTTNEFIVNAATKIRMVSPLVEIVASTKVDITSPDTNTTGKITAQNDITSLTKVLAQIGVFAGGYNPYVPGQPNLVKGKLSVVAEGASPGDIEAAGNVKDSVRTMAADRVIYNGHNHPETNGAGGTGTPNQPM
jgi:phage baseplate assembly protein V